MQEELDLISVAEQFGSDAHHKVNHLYDDKAYSVHLKITNKYVQKYQFLLRVDLWKTALAASWLHDTIEDCRLTYNDIKQTFGEAIAEVVYAVSNEKGRNRTERANDKYYDGILANEVAHFIKLCDRLANIDYATTTGSKMVKVYTKEMPNFKNHLYDIKFDSMFKEMDEMLNF